MTMKLILVLLYLGHGVLGNSVQQVSTTNFLSEIMASFKGPMNMTKLMSTFQMPSCFESCIPHMEGMFKVMKKGTRDPIAVNGMCQELQESAKCAVNAGCSTVFVETAAKLFQFVCLENIESVGDSLECVKNAAEDLQPECENHCKLQARLIDQASSANQIDNVFDVKNMCNSTICLMHCVKDRLGEKCVGQTNLVDTLISSVMRGENGGFEEMLDWVVPQACKDENFIVNLPQDTSKSGLGSVTSGNADQIPHNVGTVDSNHIDGVSMNNEIRTIPHEDVMTTEPIEAALLIDGELRTLQCSMYDWQRNPVPTPDFESLAKIMTAHVLPYKLAHSKDPKVKIPSDNDELNAETRVEEKEKEAEEDAEKKNSAEQRKRAAKILDTPIVIPKSGISAILSAVTLFILLSTIF
ncbi:unnamed protein product [Auanema sp. JU1783]|nr:unnamed protein product [Auanema sp. JU1783]